MIAAESFAICGALMVRVRARVRVRVSPDPDPNPNPTPHPSPSLRVGHGLEELHGAEEVLLGLTDARALDVGLVLGVGVRVRVGVGVGVRVTVGVGVRVTVGVGVRVRVLRARSLLRDDAASDDVGAADDARGARLLAQEAALAEEGAELAGRVRARLLPLPRAGDGDAWSG